MKKQRRVASKRRWSTEKVLSEVRKLRDLSAKSVQRRHPMLYGAAIRYFRSWKIAVERAGFDYATVVKRKLPGFWSRERVIQEIGELSEKNSNHVRKSRRALYSAALRIFGSWRTAVESSGHDYDTVRRDWLPSDSTHLRFKKRKG